MAATSDIVMPKLGLTMTEGILAEWKVRPGSAVHAGDTLFVVETEKVANDVEADRDGVIDALLVEAGATVPVGAPIARFRETDGAAVSATPPAKKTEPQLAAAVAATKSVAAPMPSKIIGATGGRTIATPYARRLARERGIDLSGLHGSGPRGRIKAADVEGAAVSRQAVAADFSPVAAGMPHFQFLLRLDGSRLTDLRASIARSAPELTIPLVAFVAMAAARATAGMGTELAQSGAMTITTRSAAVSIDDAAKQGLRAIAERLASGGQQAPRNAESAIAIADLEIASAEFFAPPVGPHQILTIGVGGVQSGTLGLSLAIRGEIGAGDTAVIVESITRYLEHPWAMLASA